LEVDLAERGIADQDAVTVTGEQTAGEFPPTISIYVLRSQSDHPQWEYSGDAALPDLQTWNAFHFRRFWGVRADHTIQLGLVSGVPPAIMPDFAGERHDELRVYNPNEILDIIGHQLCLGGACQPLLWCDQITPCADNSASEVTPRRWDDDLVQMSLLERARLLYVVRGGNAGVRLRWVPRERINIPSDTPWYLRERTNQDVSDDIVLSDPFGEPGWTDRRQRWWQSLSVEEKTQIEQQREQELQRAWQARELEEERRAWERRELEEEQRAEDNEWTE